MICLFFLRFKEVLKVILFGIIEGVSEWLPISSSGHLLLLDSFFSLDWNDSFKEVFFIFIQLGAILAIVILFFKRLTPIKYSKKLRVDKESILIWKKVIISCIPGAIITFILDDFINDKLNGPYVICLSLFIYGIIFILIENYNKKRTSLINDHAELTYKYAFYIGLFQSLSLIPGTSRSGATIIGALLLGVNRVVASEFSFYLSIPVMFGMSLFKLIKVGIIFSLNEICLLFIGMLVSFITSLIVVKYLLKYLKEHDFKIFGLYRIALSILILIYLYA